MMNNYDLSNGLLYIPTYCADEVCFSDKNKIN